MLAVLKPRGVHGRAVHALTMLSVALARQYGRVTGPSGATRYWKRRVNRLVDARLAQRRSACPPTSRS